MSDFTIIHAFQHRCRTWLHVMMNSSSFRWYFVVNGGFETTDQICKHPDIKAVSFVGGNGAGEYVYKTGT